MKRITKYEAITFIVGLVLVLMPFWSDLLWTLDGTDDKAIELVGQLAPDYKQWFSNAIEISDSTEKMFFRFK
jgi:ABC-type cobalt transport system substrate-binding protein